jgi:hypothetical protein
MILKPIHLEYNLCKEYVYSLHSTPPTGSKEALRFKQGRGAADQRGKAASGFRIATLGRLSGKMASHRNGRGGKMSEAIEAGNGKARKRSSAKAASRLDASKVKATIHLSAEASQRLTVHAAMPGKDR